jgi:hypothetical protein
MEFQVVAMLTGISGETIIQVSTPPNQWEESGEKHYKGGLVLEKGLSDVQT